jgi:hypothetical protein
LKAESSTSLIQKLALDLFRSADNRATNLPKTPLILSSHILLGIPSDQELIFLLLVVSRSSIQKSNQLNVLGLQNSEIRHYDIFSHYSDWLRVRRPVFNSRQAKDSLLASASRPAPVPAHSSNQWVSEFPSPALTWPLTSLCHRVQE